MKALFIILLLTLSACGKRPNQIDPAFQPLYDQFITEANANGLNLDKDQGITIQFSTLEQKTALGEVVGDCSGLSYGNSTINVDQSFWNQSGYAAQQILLYHELGHCVLYEAHTTNPDAIMNPLITNPLAFYAPNMDGMIKDLFKAEGDGD
jgi:hypothetical protein